MNKRKFLQTLLATGSVVLVAKRYIPAGTPAPAPDTAPRTLAAPAPSAAMPAGLNPTLEASTAKEEFELMMQQESELRPGFKHSERAQTGEVMMQQLPNETVDQYLEKIRNYDHTFASDIYLRDANTKLLVPTIARLDRIQSFVGHANFNLISFEEILYFARNYPEIGKFEKTEMDFMDEIFHADATTYGFFGEKITPDIKHRILQKDVVKIDGTGHYLMRGESLTHYQQIHKDVGNELTLTSGIRNNVKQLHLFLAKTFQSEGNLSRASRSLAPPGHSFHGVGDFDVGKVGMGEQNFTADFAATKEYRRLINLGYVDIRYTDTHKFGVRYEPWHIKIENDSVAHCSHGSSPCTA